MNKEILNAMLSVTRAVCPNQAVAIDCFIKSLFFCYYVLPESAKISNRAPPHALILSYVPLPGVKKYTFLQFGILTQK